MADLLMRATELTFVVLSGEDEYSINIQGTNPPDEETYMVFVADLTQTVLYGVSGQPMNRVHVASGLSEWTDAIHKGVERVLEMAEEKAQQNKETEAGCYDPHGLER